MERRFPTYEEAALYAAKLQSEGYFAKIANETAGGIWGHNGVITGYRVLVSETTGARHEEPAPVSRLEHLFLNLVRFVVVAVILLGVGWGLLELASYLLRGGWKPALLTALATGVALYALAGWSALLSKAVGHSRGERPSLVFSLSFILLAAALAALAFV